MREFPYQQIDQIMHGLFSSVNTAIKRIYTILYVNVDVKRERENIESIAPSHELAKLECTIPQLLIYR